MPAYEDCRLVIKGFWGDNRRAFKLAHTTRAALIRAFKRGDLRDLALFGEQDENDTNSVLAAGLAFRLLFPASYNDTSKWDVDTGGAEVYFDDWPAIEGFVGAGLGYESSDDGAAFFTTKAPSGSGFPQLRNAGFAVRCLIFAPTGFAVFTLGRWGGTGNRWQLQLIDGSLHIMRLAATWSQSDEDDLHTLLAVENPTTLQLAEITTLKGTLYKDFTPLSVFGGKDDWYGVARMIMLLPEPRGIVWIWDGAKWAKARHSDVLKTRQVGTVWSDSRLTVGTSGPAFYWQVGYPWFTETGVLPYPQYKTPSWMDAYTAWEFNAVESVGNTLLGTSIVYENIVNLVWSYARATFSTTNRRYTPFLYAFAAMVPAGNRTGSTSTAWDSADGEYADDHGNSPILDVQPSCEGENRARTYTFLIRDVAGGTFGDLGGNYDSGAWHMFDYYEGGVKLISNGLIVRAEFGDMRNTEYNQVRAEVAHDASIVTLTGADQWAILDNHVILEDPTGDFLRVSDHIRQVLNLPGIPSTEYTGVVADTGRLCGAAIPGEDWKTRPSRGVTAGEYLRNYVRRKGNGRILQHTAAGWDFDYRSTALFSIGGNEANFTSDADANDPSSYPGRWAILRRLKLVFDWDEYANEFVVIGAEDEAGNRITHIARINRAINPTTVINPRIYTGIPRRKYFECPDSVSSADVSLDRRSLQLELGLPPRWNAFETYYHRGLCPGWRITADTTPARTFRVTDGSWAEDRQIVIYRELEV